MITGNQIRMARAALRLGVRDLAKAAGVAPMTISRLENGHSGGLADTLRRVEAALEQAGAKFIAADEWIGVLVKDTVRAPHREPTQPDSEAGIIEVSEM